MSDETFSTSKRRQREQAAPALSAQSPSASAKPVPTPLEDVLGQGADIALGDRTYEMSPLPIGKIGKAQELLGRWPEVLYFGGFTPPAADGSALDAAKVAEMLTAVNAGMGEDAVQVTTENVFQAIAHLSTNIDADQVSAMAELIALALRRRHPEVTADEIADVMDIPTALRALRVFFGVNGGLRSRFSQP